MAAAPPWPVVQDESWQCAQTPTLPFLGFHEHTALRPIGEVTIQIPASPFFSLFLADDVKSEASARRGGGQSAVVFGSTSSRGNCGAGGRSCAICIFVAVRAATRAPRDDSAALQKHSFASTSCVSPFAAEKGFARQRAS